MSRHEAHASEKKKNNDRSQVIKGRSRPFRAYTVAATRHSHQQTTASISNGVHQVTSEETHTETKKNFAGGFTSHTYTNET